MRRRFFDKNRELEDFLIRFYPAGNYTWVVPAGCTEVDVFLVGGGGGSGGSVDQLGDEFYAGSDGSDAPGITDGNGIYHPPGTKYGGGKGQGYTTRDFGEPTGKRNAGGGGADRNRDGGMGGESDYDEGCGIGRGNRKSGGYGGGGCGSEGTGGDGTVLISVKIYKS